MTIIRKTLLAMACIAAFPVCAQTVTTPPRTISSQQETQGSDSTLRTILQSSSAQGSTISIPLPAAPLPPTPPVNAGGGNPPPVTCLVGQTSTATITQNVGCPVGYQTGTHSLTFTQSATRTTTTSCPSGPYGAPAYTSTDGPWSPSIALACPVPIVQRLTNDGQTYAMNVTVPVLYLGHGVAGDASLAFQATATGWRVLKAGWAQPTTVVDSGSLPTGAVAVTYAVSAVTQSGDGRAADNAVATNGAAALTPLASAPTIKLSTPNIQGNSSKDSDGSATVTVNFYNAAGQQVGTSTFTFHVSAAGTA